MNDGLRGIGGAAGRAVNVQKFTASGTWIKPPGISFVRAVLIGGGGGGGSGRRGAAGTQRQGGHGGQGGQRREITLPADLFRVNEPVEVGTGGSGGAAIGADNTNGIAGNAGGHTRFAFHSYSIPGFVIAAGGVGGSGGTNTLTAQDTSLFQGSDQGLGGADATPASPDNTTRNGADSAGGGGAGGEIDAANVVSTGLDGGVSNTFVLPQGSSAGGVGGDATDSTLIGLSGSGGGGGGATTKAGGKGGKYGGGGGGGAASANGSASGAGNSGADGCAIIFSW